MTAKPIGYPKLEISSTTHEHIDASAHITHVLNHDEEYHKNASLIAETLCDTTLSGITFIAVDDKGVMTVVAGGCRSTVIMMLTKLLEEILSERVSPPPGVHN